MLIRQHVKDHRQLFGATLNRNIDKSLEHAEIIEAIKEERKELGLTDLEVDDDDIFIENHTNLYLKAAENIRIAKMK